MVDALIDTQPMMKDWECMTDLLLEEPGEFENELTQTEEAILIDIMTLSIIQTVTGISPRLAKSVIFHFLNFKISMFKFCGIWTLKH